MTDRRRIPPHTPAHVPPHESPDSAELPPHPPHEIPISTRARTHAGALEAEMQFHAPHAEVCGGEAERVGKNRRLVEAIAAAITPVELALLAQYLFDGMTQMEIKDRIGMPRSTVSFRLHKAKRKLQIAGIPVKFPGKGRRKRKEFSTGAMDALNVTDEGDLRHGRWRPKGRDDRGR